MANATALGVMRLALQQYGYTESPAGSNRTKFGKEFGMNGQPWCMIFEWWCGENAKGENPFPHNANAAYGQDEIVSKKGGKWIMPKTASNATKEAALKKVRFGDCGDFDFGKNNLYRLHTALCLGAYGEYYYFIEANTSPGDGGSQSNGGGVYLRKRHYTQVCSVARPKYKAEKLPVPEGKYTGKLPSLPSRGYFKYGDNGVKVKLLQQALKWANKYDLQADGDFGPHTFAEVVIFQVANGLVPDGEAGVKTMAKLASFTESKPVTPTKKKQYVPEPGDKCYDLSNYQGKLSVDYFKGIKKKGVKSVILRSSYTKLAEFKMYKDAAFDNNIKNAIKAGLHIGIYHFSQAKTKNEAGSEYDFCHSCIKPYADHIDLPVAIDTEFGRYKDENGEWHDGRLTPEYCKSLGKTKFTEVIMTFCKAAKKDGFEPMVYASLTFFNNYLLDNIYKKVKVWVAQYYKKCQYRHPYFMWQFTSNDGRLDENVFGTQDTKEKSKADKIHDKAVSLAYKYGVSSNNYNMTTGKPKESYKKALDKIFPNHNSWKPQIRTGASCSVYVATVMRATGVDTTFKCDDPPKIMTYMDGSSKWQKVNSGNKPVTKDKLKYGDVICYEKTGANGNGHILIYRGEGYICEANFGRCYPHTLKLPSAYINESYINKTYKRFGVYRAR